MDLGSAVLSAHARDQLLRRGIEESVVRIVLENPDSVQTISPERIIAQRRVTMVPTQTDYLVRVIIDVDRNPNEIVTVYRTTKFAKYGG